MPAGANSSTHIHSSHHRLRGRSVLRRPANHGAQACQSKTQALFHAGQMVELRAARGWGARYPPIELPLTFQYVVAVGPGAAGPGVAGGAAQNNSSPLSLPLRHRSYTLAGMKVLSSFIPASSLESLHFKPAVARRKRPASNHSIERTVQGLRPSPAAHVKRWASQGTWL